MEKFICINRETGEEFEFADVDNNTICMGQNGVLDEFITKKLFDELYVKK